MKTTPFLEYIVCDVFGEDEPITFRAMMGAFILYYEGRAFAIVEDEELYFKGNKENFEWYLSQGGVQFSYVRHDEVAYLYYFSVPPHIYEDPVVFEEWLIVALSSTKPPKPKKKKVVR